VGAVKHLWGDDDGSEEDLAYSLRHSSKVQVWSDALDEEPLLRGQTSASSAGAAIWTDFRLVGSQTRWADASPEGREEVEPPWQPEQSPQSGALPGEGERLPKKRRQRSQRGSRRQ
ncbi:unnamed protein product, partial [Polarella glacialis]